jgi:choline-sulfatase
VTPRHPSADAPNILVIMSDQHNARVLGAAGDPVVRTPNLDALAESGALLENLYCQAPLCAPSRMSFLTGMLPSQNGVMTNEQMPAPGHPTFAHSAGAAGYRPYLVGKMHALGPDQLQGYVDRAVGDHGPNYAGGGTRPARGPLDGAMGPAPDSLRKIGAGRNAYQVRDEFAAEAAISHLRRHAIEQRSTGRRQPFFLSVGLMLPHQPYVALREEVERYVDRVPPPRVPRADTPADDHPFYRWWRTATGIGGGVPERVVDKARTSCWAMVDRLDRIVGGILETVRDLGMADDTLVVYTSDHGDHIGEHGLWWNRRSWTPPSRFPASSPGRA